MFDSSECESEYDAEEGKFLASLRHILLCYAYIPQYGNICMLCFYFLRVYGQTS